MMIIAPTLAMMAVAAPLKGEWKPSYARQQLDLQMNSSGFPCAAYTFIPSLPSR